MYVTRFLRRFAVLLWGLNLLLGSLPAFAQSPLALPNPSFWTTDASNQKGTAAVARQPDGGTVFAGLFQKADGLDRYNIARLNPDGTLDRNWTAPTNGMVFALAVDQATGAIYVGGNFTTIGGQARNRIAKLAANGSVDTSWNPSSDGYINVLTLHNGAIYAGGSFGQIGSQSRNNLAKLASTGSGAADTGWNPAPNGKVNALAVDSAGTVFVGGDFNHVSGQGRRYLAKVLANGTVDPTWNPGANQDVQALALSGSSVYVGGFFFNVNGSASIGGLQRDYIAKLSATGNGAADPTWLPAGADGHVFALVVDNDGTLYAGGRFFNIGGVARQRIAKLSGSGAGSVDANWTPSSNNDVRVLTKPDSAGVLYASGYFDYIGGKVRPGNIAALPITVSYRTLTYSAGPNGTISGTSPQTLLLGGTGTPVTPVPNGNYRFMHWSDGSTANPRTDVDVMTNITVSATFAPVQHLVSVSWPGNGTVTPASRMVDHGSTATFSVVPAAGYQAAASGCGGSLNGTTYTTAPITAHCPISVAFTLIPDNQILVAVRTLTGNGTVTPLSQRVDPGTRAVFSVVPGTGNQVAISGCGGSLSGSTYTTAPITAYCPIDVAFSPIIYTVMATAGANGTITPASRSVNHGETTIFTVIPNAGFQATVGGCGGSLSGLTYTTGPITTNCAVTASFVGSTYTVTATAGANGTITPASRTVNAGATTTFTVTPATNYRASVSGCSGSLNGSTYTTGAITAACTVSASFALNQYTLTYSAGANGTIIGTSPQTVVHGASGSAVIAVANNGYQFTQWSDGSTVNPRTDSNVTATLSVSASFMTNAPNLSLTINAGRSHARYGQVLSYAITLNNSGTAAASPVSIAMVLPMQLDAGNTSWTCTNGGAGALCTASGNGSLQDTGVVLPAGRSLTWLVSAPVRSNAAGGDITTTVTASAGAITANASDRITLVLMRDGFEPGGDGAQGGGDGYATACAPAAEPIVIDGAFIQRFTAPPASASLFDTLLAGRSEDGAGFRVVRANLVDGAQMQLITIDADRHEIASVWSSIDAGTTLALTVAATADGTRQWWLDGAEAALTAPLWAALSNTLRIQIPANRDAGCY